MQRHQPPKEFVSVAHELDGARLNAPSAERNAGPITDLLRLHAPQYGSALEIASGTGQHVASFAAALPGITWQPSDIDATRCASIDAWAADQDNIKPAIALDAATPGWHDTLGGKDLIVLINLLHLISAPQARCIISEVAQALATNGRFVLYGPFLRNGVATSPGDRYFDDRLRASDPVIGYKDTSEIKSWLAEAGLSLLTTIDMPSNNLAFISEHRSETP